MNIYNEQDYRVAKARLAALERLADAEHTLADSHQAAARKYRISGLSFDEQADALRENIRTFRA